MTKDDRTLNAKADQSIPEKISLASAGS